MARTVRSEIDKRRNGESGEPKEGSGGGSNGVEKEQERMGQKNFELEEDTGGEHVVEVEEEEEDGGGEHDVGEVEAEEEDVLVGRGKRIRKETATFQFAGQHVLFSQTSEKYKQKNLTLERSKEKRARFYKKKYFMDLKNQIKELKSTNKKLASKLEANSRKIKTWKAKK